MVRSGSSPQAHVPAARRSRFATTDPDEAEEFLDRMYTARLGSSAASWTSPLAVSEVSAGGLSSVDLALPPDLTLSVEGTDDLSVTTLLSGTTEAEIGKGIERYQAGDVSLGSYPRSDLCVACRQLHVHVLTVPAAVVTDVVGSMDDRPLRPLRFRSLAPSSAAAAERWRGTAAFVRSVLDDDAAAANPLILGSAVRLAAATALSVFPRDLPAEPDSTGDATPSVLRRAIAFIDENAAGDVGLVDIARACHVTPRTVQYAFSRHLETTPSAYLRRVRLEYVHRELVAADPATTTVAAVAARWGFMNHSRFTAHYRATFGVLPSTTLRDR